VLGRRHFSENALRASLNQRTGSGSSHKKGPPRIASGSSESTNHRRSYWKNPAGSPSRARESPDTNAHSPSLAPRVPIRTNDPLPDAPYILCVDDNRDVSDSHAMLMRLYGFTAEARYDGAAALALTGQVLPDLCFIDMNMPVMDGDELARKLSALEPEHPPRWSPSPPCPARRPAAASRTPASTPTWSSRPTRRNW
jgi:CheY-like chemotaxis protein